MGSVVGVVKLVLGGVKLVLGVVILVLGSHTHISYHKE